ncbi:MAG: protein translocase SEC61 complex subunit gamma [Sulfolobales archaeon]
MDFKGLIDSWRRILAIAEKPEPKEYSLMLRVVISGLFLVGLIGLLIHLAFYFIQGGYGG